MHITRFSLSRCGRSLLCGLAALTLAACSDDEATQPPTPQQAAPLQVCVVFEPDELGDQGYADNVLRGIEQVNRIDPATGKERLDMRLMSLPTTAETSRQLNLWINDRANSFYPEQNYERRLLVLTHVSLLEGIDFSTFPEQDELLLLDADPNLAESHTLQGLGKRVHFVNISAADAARRYYRQCSEWADLNDEDIFRNVCTIRWYKGISYQDSVDIAIQEMFDAGVAEGRIDTMTVVETEEDLKEYDNTNLRQFGYTFATFIDMLHETMNFGSVICDMGRASSGFDTYIFAHSPEFITLLIDAESCLSKQRYAVQRQFGRATAQWISRWLDAEPQSMPTLQWHGRWDGYCTDDIPWTGSEDDETDDGE